MIAPEFAIAFDVATLEQALALHQRLGEGPELAKIGLELFTAAGPEAVRALTRRGRRVFLDLKLHDIPNTVAGAAAAASALGASLVTVHAAGGEAMVRAAVEGARRGGDARIVAVTLLTSLDPLAMPPGFAKPFAIADVQAEMLAMTERAGAHGIVCAATDLAALRERHPAPFFAVTPGIRPAGGAAQDQRRVASIADATAQGASLIVLGRAITQAADPLEALLEARAERDVVSGGGPSI